VFRYSINEEKDMYTKTQIKRAQEKYPVCGHDCGAEKCIQKNAKKECVEFYKF
jgi:hypothetical protein